VVIDVVGDSHSEIFFNYDRLPATAQCSSPFTGVAVALHVVNGSLEQLWEITDLLTLPYSHLAVSKVPGTNNEAIVCAFNSSGTSFFCADAATGTILLTQSITTNNQCRGGTSTWSAVSIERFFPDDVDPSLFIIAQSQVFRYNSLTRTTSFHCGIPWPGPNVVDIPFAIDIDLDGTAELFTQNCVYRASNCSLLWCSSPSFRVFPGVANIDMSTPEAEVVMAGAGIVALYNHKGLQLWNVSVVSGGGPPVIADFDGNGVPDIGVACARNSYVIFSGVDGTLLRNFTIKDSSLLTGSSAFDFQNDGAYEIVYVSGQLTYVFSMNWNKTFGHSSGTATEYSVIADIDLDGSADIVSTGYNPIVVLSSNDTWPAATTSWTTHGHNSRKLDRFNYPRVMRATSTFRSGDKPRFVSALSIAM